MISQRLRESDVLDLRDLSIGMILVHFCKNYTTNVTLANMKNILKTRYSHRIRMVHSDGESAGLVQSGRNGIRREARLMRILAKLPRNL